MNDVDFKAFRSDAPRELGLALLFAVIAIAGMIFMAGCGVTQRIADKVDTVLENTTAAETGVETAEAQSSATVESYTAEARLMAAAKARSDFAVIIWSDSRPTDARAVLQAYDTVAKDLAAEHERIDKRRTERLTGIYRAILSSLGAANYVIGSADEILHRIAAAAARIRGVPK